MSRGGAEKGFSRLEDQNQIAAIPDDLELHELRWLDLSNNNILVINPARLP